VTTQTLQATPTHQTAVTQVVEANGTRIACRRFGMQDGVPLVFFQHFAGNLENWDPKITDGFARDREVILFDNAGVASSGGEVPTTIEGMARHAINLIEALDITKVDLFGFSTGSLIAQEVTVERPDLVRRLVLVGSAPRGGVGMAMMDPKFQAMVVKKYETKDGFLLDSLFGSSEASQADGCEFVIRLHEPTENRDVDVNDKVALAQTAALAAWGAQARIPTPIQKASNNQSCW
jgi:pimeloyl-ACP methyl ester carboxylesterase